MSCKFKDQSALFSKFCLKFGLIVRQNADNNAKKSFEGEIRAKVYVSDILLRLKINNYE